MGKSGIDVGKSGIEKSLTPSLERVRMPLSNIPLSLSKRTITIEIRMNGASAASSMVRQLSHHNE